jgi:hypothetical protein
MGVTFFSDVKPEHFALFDRSLITMFRITSGEAWADYMPPIDDEGTVSFGTCIFFVSYTVIVCWTLLQVRTNQTRQREPSSLAARPGRVSSVTRTS